MDDLVSVIIETVLREPEHNWRVALTEALSRFEREQELARQIKVGPKSGGEVPLSKVGFEPVGRGIRPLDGKAYTVHEPRMLMRKGLGGRRPHNNGEPLTEDQIKSTLDQWNKHAGDTVKGQLDGGGTR